MSVDLEYIESGMFTKFFPVSEQGRGVWDTMQQDGVASVLSIHKESVIAQMRKAGYSVKKAKPSALSDEALLNELLN